MHIRIILSIFLALFAAGAAVAGDNGPFVTAEGRLAAPTPRKTAGTVVAKWQSKIILRDAAGESIIVEFRGGTAFSPEIEAMLKKEPHPPTLTERQRQILEHTINGLSADQIAKRMNLSSFTVNEHLDAVKRKLGAANRTEAVAIALKKQILKI